MYCLLSLSAVLKIRVPLVICRFPFPGSICAARSPRIPYPSLVPAGTYLFPPSIHPLFIPFLSSIHFWVISYTLKYTVIYFPCGCFLMSIYGLLYPYPLSRLFQRTCLRRPAIGVSRRTLPSSCAVRLTLFIIPLISIYYRHTFTPPSVVSSLPRLFDVLRATHLWCS